MGETKCPNCGCDTSCEVCGWVSTLEDVCEVERLKRRLAVAEKVIELAQVWHTEGKWEPGSERKAFRYALKSYYAAKETCNE